MRVGDIAKVVKGPDCFLNMICIISSIQICDSLDSNRGRLIAEVFELEDLGGDSYEFYVDTLEVVNASR
jgi:hypothetical protein